MSTIDTTTPVSDKTSVTTKPAAPDVDIIASLRDLIQLSKSAYSSNAATLDNLNTDNLYAQPGSDSPSTSAIANPSAERTTTAPAEPTVTGKITAPAEPTVTGKITAPAEPTVTGKITAPAEPTSTGKITAPAEPTSTGKITAPAEPTVTGTTTESHPEAAKIGDQTDTKVQTDIQKEDQKLSDWADKNLQEPQKSQFKSDLTEFEKRAQQDGLPQDEVLKTYQQIERLTDATGNKPVSQTERDQLAYEVLHQAAEPAAISQGKYDTCNVTTVETRTYTRTPSDAAKLVADVALTGQYTAADGTKVTIDPTPHDESTLFPPGDGVRSYASEIFQVTAVNLYYAQQNAKTGSDIRYEQVNPTPGDRADDGERLIDYSKNPPQMVKPDSKTDYADSSEPNLYDPNIVDISDAITGKKESIVLLSAQDKTGGGVLDITSEDQLKQTLAQLKANHQLPVIVLVDINNEPFYSDSGYGSAGTPVPSGEHVVTITDYDPTTGAVSIQNQWGMGSDHGIPAPEQAALGLGPQPLGLTPQTFSFTPQPEGTINVHELYIAMQPPAEAEQMLQQDVTYNKSHGLTNPEEEADLLGRQIREHSVTESQAVKSAEQIMDELSKDSPRSEYSQEVTKELDDAIESLSPDAKVQLFQHEYQDNLIDAEPCLSEIDDADAQAKSAYDKAPRTLGINPLAWYEYYEEQSDSKKAKASLPADTPQPPVAIAIS